MNNPNFRSLGEFGDSQPSESNDGAQDQKLKKAKKPGYVAREVADQPANGDPRRTDLAEWFRNRTASKDAKREAPLEVIIYNAKEEKQGGRAEDDKEPVVELVDEFAAAEDAAAEALDLEPSEKLEVAEAFVAVRSQAVQLESQALPPASADQPAVTANKAFLNTVARELQKPMPAAEQEGRVEQAVVTAYEDVEQQIVGGAGFQEAAMSTVIPQQHEAAAPGSLDYEDVESSDTQSLLAYAAAQAPHANAAAGGMSPPHMAYAASGNMAPQPGFAQAASGSPESAAAAERRVDVADWFVPAAAAYLWGRHNGRKKAERRLLPQQKKLETTVRELVSEVAAKEARIRQLARQQAELRAAQAVQASPAAAPSRAPQPVAEHPQTSPLASVADRYRVAEAPAPRSAAERASLGAPERPVAAMPEAAAPALASRAETPVRAKTPPEVMNHQELLAASAEIFIGSVDLKSIYEDNKISEEGLRRLVIEHAHGGDIRSIIKDEMLKHEMKYELDPMQDEQPSPEAAPVRQPQAPMLPPWLMDSLPTAPPEILHAEPEPILPPEPLPAPRSRRSSSIISSQTRRTVQPMLVAANAVAFTMLTILLAVLLFIWLR